MRKPIYAILISLLMVLLAVSAQSQVIAPELESALQSLGPDEEVPVIVTLADKVNLKLFKDKDKGLRRTRLINALMSKADSTQKPLKAFLQEKKAKRMISLWLINGMAVTAKADAIRKLAKHPLVDRVQLDYAIPLADGASTASAPAEWNVDAVRAPELWVLGYSGQGVVVATMDSGVDPNHLDLTGRYRGGTNSWYDPNGQHPTPYDANGHGTSAMGLMVGGDGGGTAIGMAPDAQWIAVKIFNDLDQASLSAIHQGFQWLLNPDGIPTTNDAPDIVNNSWILDNTTDECNMEFTNDIAALKAAEIAVVFAAGNTGPGPGTSVSPSNDPGSFAVGAVTQSQSVANFSGRGPSACGGGTYPQIVAPGVNVYTADLTFGGLFPNSYTWVSGTSFSAPHVAGGMALLKSAMDSQGVSVTVSQLESAVQETASDLGDPGPDDDYGAGLLDLVGAYNWLLANAGSPQPGELQFSAASYVVAEDGGSITLTVTRTGGSASDVTVDYATADGTAMAGQDYTATSGTLSFIEGETSQTFTVTILDDAISEGDKDLTMTLSNPTGGATLGSPESAMLIIIDEDTSPGPGDADGDGYTSDVDCDDNNASIYPGAPEIKHDGIDQDCNGYDLTIDIIKAVYKVSGDTLNVEATSALGRNADLVLQGYGSMRWDRKRGKWKTTVKNAGGDPGTVTVLGIEGSSTGITTVDAGSGGGGSGGGGPKGKKK